MNPELLNAQNPTSQNDTPGIDIGEFLVQENFITPLEYKKALDIQAQEDLLKGLPLFQIIKATKRLAPQHFTQLLLTTEFQGDFISILQEKKMLSPEIIENCLTTKPGNQSLPEYIAAQGLIPKESIDGIIFTELGDTALITESLKHGYITSGDVTFATKLSKGLRHFGDICCDLNLITSLDLYHILLKYDKQTKFGDILIRLGYLDKIPLQQALADQQESQRLLGNILVAKDLITAEQCQEALSIQANIPFDPLTTFTYDEISRQTLPVIVSARYAEKNLLIPIRTLNNQLTLALMQPEAINAVRELDHVYKQFQLTCILTTEQRFRDLFLDLYQEELILENKSHYIDSDRDDKTDFMQIDLEEGSEEELSSTAGYHDQNVQIEEIVNYIIKTGIKEGASDIHLEQDEGGTTLRFRIDGVMKTHSPLWLEKLLPEHIGPIISRIKMVANLDIAEKRIPHDGVFRICYFDKHAHKKRDVDFRVTSCPGLAGENITIRIIDSPKADAGLDLLGHRPQVLDPFKRYLAASAGMILVTGPTRSGKSSTLYGALQHIYSPTLKIITAEDPIEYSFKGIMQTQVNQKNNLTFARLLPSVLRLDPDVILVGELRDSETAAIAFDAAQSGQLVLSTLHANDSVSAVNRLLSLNIDHSQINASLLCILAQRLVRKICSSCIGAYKPAPKEWNLLFNSYPEQLEFFRGGGCPSCEATGYKGRTLLSEIFTLDAAHVIQQGTPLAEIKKQAVEHGMQTMLDDGLQKLSLTTLEEICRVLPFHMLEEFRVTQKAAAAAIPETYQFWVQDPGTELDILREIHTTHCNLAQKHNLTPVERDLFIDFLTANYDTISAEHNCTLVQFHLKVENGGISIQANPGTWGAGETTQ